MGKENEKSLYIVIQLKEKHIASEATSLKHNIFKFQIIYT